MPKWFLVSWINAVPWINRFSESKQKSIAGVEIATSCRSKPTENLFQPSRKKYCYKKADQKVLTHSAFLEKYNLTMILKACLVAACISIPSSFISALFNRKNTTVFSFHHFSFLSFFPSQLKERPGGMQLWF